MQQPAAQIDGIPSDYGRTLEEIKNRIRTAQVKAALSVNRELISLYWDIGKVIVERQQTEGWGKSIVNRLAKDLQNEFPGIAGFSPGNVRRMRAFYLAWSDPIYAQAARKLNRTANLAQAVREMEGSILPQPVAGLLDSVWLPCPMRVASDES